MNYYWLISNCSFSSVFAFLRFWVLILFFSLWYLFLCVCLIASLFPSLYFEFSHDISPYFSTVLVFGFLALIMLFVFFFVFFNILYLNIRCPFVSSQGDALLWHRNIPFKSHQRYIC